MSLSSHEDAVPEATVAVVTPVTNKTRQSPSPNSSPLFDPQKDYEERRLRRETYFVVALALIVMLAVVVTVSLIATAGNRTSVVPMNVPTAAPTLAPTSAIRNPQDRLEFVRQALADNPYTAEYATKLPESASQLTSSNSNNAEPIVQATHWLVHQDTLVDESSLMRRLALATIYYQNGGAQWTNTTNWMSTSTHHCEWFGVTCCRAQPAAPSCASDDPNALADLNLNKNQLTGPVTAIVAQLTDLRSLDLSYNQLTGTLPCSELGSLPRLMSLYLQHNTLSGELDESLRQNGVLQTLYVQRNNLTGAWPQSFCPLCFNCKGNVDAFGLDCDEISCRDDCCRIGTRCYYD